MEGAKSAIPLSAFAAECSIAPAMQFRPLDRIPLPCRASIPTASYVLAVAILAASLPPLAAASSPSAGPNILFILADDYGIDGIGCYGSDRFKGKTPHLDELAATGIRFERCYATPICGPSRCLLITGRYGFRTGGLSNDTADRARADQEPSVARVLKGAGYATGMAGKWRQMGGMPDAWGFDEYLMSDIAGSPSQIKTYTKNGRPLPVPPDRYYPDLQQTFALDFLRRHRAEPFFLYYASHLVHDPIVATPDTKPGETNKRTLYDDNVAYLDKQVGQLVAELDVLGLREHTLIIFSSDNGTDLTRGPSTIGGRMPHGGKRDMWEGGTRVPLIANWKGTTAAGRVSRDLVDLTDMLPTLADVGGASMPEGVTLDGRSFAPQLRGQHGRPRKWVFVQLGNQWFVRDDAWKLDETGTLFDMGDAPFVEQPVPADSTDAAAIAARKRLEGVLAELDPASGKMEPQRMQKTSAK
jgi:arylsulfatase A